MAKSIQQLYEFFASQRAKDTFEINEEIAVEIPASFAFEETENFSSQTEGLIPFTSNAYHDKTNINGSTIESDVFIEKTQTIPFRPVLANIIKKEDGTMDFGSHDMIITSDQYGNVLNCEYLEKPIGVIVGYTFNFDRDQAVNRAVVQGFLYEGYADEAISILERRGKVDCSIELMTKKVHFDIASETLFLDDYYVTGLTLLGEDIEPGMTGSNFKIGDFSKETSVSYNCLNKLTDEQIGQIQNFESVLFSLPEEEKSEKKGEEPMDKEKQGMDLEEQEEVLEEKIEEPVEEVMEAAPEEVAEDPQTVSLEEYEALKHELEEIKSALEKYQQAELLAQKEAVLADEAYAPFIETEEFAFVKEKMGTLSVEELKIQTELAYAKCVRNTAPAKPEVKEVTKATIFAKPEAKAKSRYGQIFDEK